MVRVDTKGSVDLAEVLDGQLRRGTAVEQGNLVEDVNSLLFTAFAEEELGRLVKFEDKIPGDEDGECNGANDDHLVAPAHIAGHGAAGHTAADGAASGQCDIASILRSGTIGDDSADDDADRLPHAQQRHEGTAVLRQVLERNSGVNGDIAAETDTREKVDPADRPVAVHARRLELRGWQVSKVWLLRTGCRTRQRTRSMPKTLVMRHEEMNAHLRPYMSEMMPKPNAPMLRHIRSARAPEQQ